MEHPGPDHDDAATGAPRSPRNSPPWTAVEVAALVMLPLAWVLLPYLGILTWLAFGAVGLVLVWASGVWRRITKVAATAIVIALYAFVILIVYPVKTTVSPAGSPIVVQQT